MGSRGSERQVMNMNFSGKAVFLTIALWAISYGSAFATDVGGPIIEDTSWLNTDEPYQFISGVEVRPEVTLTIGPGVTVIAADPNSTLVVSGTLDVQGTKSEKILFRDVHIANGPRGLASVCCLFTTHQINIDHAVIEGGSVINSLYSLEYGSLRLTNSHLIGTGYMHVYSPLREVLIEGNVFESAGGIMTVTQNGVDPINIVIRRNRFIDQQGSLDGSTRYAIKELVGNVISKTIVEENDFVSTNLVAISVARNGSTEPMIARNNWWGTTDESSIPDRILDVNDSTNVSLRQVEYLPIAQQAFTLPKFADVPEEYWAHEFIELLASSNITSGCGNDNYCPTSQVTRAQMAVFLERGINGSDFIPPAATGNAFLDVGAGDFAANFIEQLASDGITVGCGNNNYCPTAEITRDQMAVFLLRAKHGSSYSPPPATGIFADVDQGHWAVHWIEQLAAEGITAGCGGGNYCPNAIVTRDQMAVFLVRTFGL